MSARVHILVGEGIECEKESERFFARALGCETRRLRLQDILRDASAAAGNIETGDWVFLPGGFSFADHFGSGRLLAFELARGGFLPKLFGRGAHLMGVCNGFQTLAELDLFGPDVRLRPNRGEREAVGAFRRGFVNRWVQVRGEGLAEGFSGALCVRHGEGRVVCDPAGLSPNVTPILFYADERFDNGSFDRIAGLAARHGRSLVVGTMPHPEIVARPIDDPNVVGAEHFPQARARLGEFTGAGVAFTKLIMEGAMQ